MLIEIYETFVESWKIFRRDRQLKLWSLFPVLLGIVFYFFLGKWMYSELLQYGRQKIFSYFEIELWASFFYYALFFLISLALVLLINYTFVLVVSLVASPFNDLLASRVAFIVRRSAPREEREKNLWGKVAKIFLIFKNELKKIAFISVLAIFAFFLGLIPLLIPLSLALAALLIAISFSDYLWCHDNLKFKECAQKFKRGLAINLISGLIFLFLLSIPILNLFFYPFAVIFFTLITIKER